MAVERILKFGMGKHEEAEIEVPKGARFISAAYEGDEVVLYAVGRAGKDVGPGLYFDTVKLTALALNTGAYAPPLDKYWSLGIAVVARAQDNPLEAVSHVFVEKEPA